MKKYIKKIIPFILFIIVFITLLSLILKFYSTDQPLPISTSQINDILIENGFIPVDITDSAQVNFPNAGLKNCIVTEQNDLRFEYYNFDNQSSAVKLYREAQKLIITTKMDAPRTEIETGKFNYKFYSLEANGHYSVTIYVGNTAVYAYCDTENQSKIINILDTIGYVNAKSKEELPPIVPSIVKIIPFVSYMIMAIVGRNFWWEATYISAKVTSKQLEASEKSKKELYNWILKISPRKKVTKTLLTIYKIYLFPEFICVVLAILGCFTTNLNNILNVLGIITPLFVFVTAICAKVFSIKWK